MSFVKKEITPTHGAAKFLYIIKSQWYPEWRIDHPPFFFKDIEYETLRQIKNKIDDEHFYKKWDEIKKYYNPYEFIHISSSYLKRQENVAFYIPLSRSYFKLWELIFDYNIIQKSMQATSLQQPWRSVHLAEGPGGFVEAVCKYREIYKLNRDSDEYYAITLKASKREIPGFNQNNYFLKRHPNINIHYGKDETGNLYNPENITSFVRYVTEKNGYQPCCQLVTADGGFDFSIDFNCQEQLCLRLLIAQITTGLQLLYKKGNFILKIFDTYLRPSIEIIWILSLIFDKIHLVKPVTSRPANSEKYLVAIGYRGCPSFLLRHFSDILSIYYNRETLEGSSTPQCLHSFLPFMIPQTFIKDIQEYNALHTRQQLTITRQIVHVIENGYVFNLKELLKTNINLCIQWCFKYRVPINRQCKYLHLLETKYRKSLGLGTTSL